MRGKKYIVFVDLDDDLPIRESYKLVLDTTFFLAFAKLTRSIAAGDDELKKYMENNEITDPQVIERIKKYTINGYRVVVFKYCGPENLAEVEEGIKNHFLKMISDEKWWKSLAKNRNKEKYYAIYYNKEPKDSKEWVNNYDFSEEGTYVLQDFVDAYKVLRNDVKKHGLEKVTKIYADTFKNKTFEDLLKKTMPASEIEKIISLIANDIVESLKRLRPYEENELIIPRYSGLL